MEILDVGVWGVTDRWPTRIGYFPWSFYDLSLPFPHSDLTDKKKTEGEKAHRNPTVTGSSLLVTKTSVRRRVDGGKLGPRSLIKGSIKSGLTCKKQRRFEPHDVLNND